MNEYADRDFTDVEARYRRQVARAYGYLTLRGYPERDPRLSAVPLERIFIKLSTTTTRAPALEMPLLGRMRALEELPERWLRGQRERLALEGRELTEEEAGELLQRYEWEAEERRKPERVTLSVPEALCDHECLVVTGPPGSGKTTLLRWLALTFAEGKQAQPDRLGDAYPHERLPVLVELRRFHGRFEGNREQLTTVNLADEIAAFVAGDARFEGTPSEFIRQALANGECLVAFDGLDEIAEFTARQRASAALQAFADNYAARGNHIIVTSRPAGYKGVELGPGFQRCEINPFTPEDVSEFIHHWCEAAYYPDLTTAQAEADELVKAIEDNDRVAKLAEAPLLCTIIAIVYRNSRILPNRRVELYLKCCEALLDTWERVKEIRQSGLIGGFDWQTKLELLSPLAYWLHSEEGRTAAPEAEFQHRLAAELQHRRLCEEPKAEQEARAFLNAIRERSGLLLGRGDGTLEFPHLTFQEYLAARHIAAAPDVESLLDMFMPHLHEAWWREVHLLTVGHLGSGRDGAPKATALLEAILDRYKPPLRCLRAFPYRRGPFGGLRNLPARAFPRWQLVRRLAWAMQRECFFAASALGDCAPLGVTNEGRDRVRAALEEVLLLATSSSYRPGQDDALLFAAASSLVQLGEASPEVIRVLTTVFVDSVGYGRVVPASRLRRFSEASPEVIRFLVAALGDSGGDVRRAAVLGLGELGEASPEVIGFLVTTLGDSDGYVRLAAASSLGQLGEASPEVIRVLVAALSDSDGYVRRAAAESLARLSGTSPEVIRFLVAALSDSDEYVRRAAVLGLARLSGTSPEVIRFLVAALSDSDGVVRVEAASSLVQLGEASPEVIGALVTALGDRDGYVRGAAVESLGELGEASPEVIGFLVTTLGDSDGYVRLAAASSLGQLGEASPEVIRFLVAALSDSDGYVRRAAAESLARLSGTSPEVIRFLVAALSDSDEYVRRAAVLGLGGLDEASPEVIRALVTALGDSDEYVRRAAAESLDRLGEASPEVIGALVTSLGDRDGYVRWAAVSGLVRLGEANPEVIGFLVTALGDSDGRVRRRAAAYSLDRLGEASPEVIGALVTALGDSDEEVQWAAVSGLVRLGEASPEVIGFLVAALGDSDGEVRLAAASSLGRLGQVTTEVMVTFNRALHDSSDSVRLSAHKSLSRLLDGKSMLGDKWELLKERRRRLKQTIRRGALILLALAMALAPLAYVLAALYLPWVRDNLWFVSILLADIAAWIAFLANVGKIRQTLGDLWR